MEIRSFEQYGGTPGYGAACVAGAGARWWWATSVEVDTNGQGAVIWPCQIAQIEAEVAAMVAVLRDEAALAAAVAEWVDAGADRGVRFAMQDDSGIVVVGRSPMGYRALRDLWAFTQAFPEYATPILDPVACRAPTDAEYSGRRRYHPPSVFAGSPCDGLLSGGDTRPLDRAQFPDRELTQAETKILTLIPEIERHIHPGRLSWYLGRVPPRPERDADLELWRSRLLRIWVDRQPDADAALAHLAGIPAAEQAARDATAAVRARVARDAKALAEAPRYYAIREEGGRVLLWRYETVWHSPDGEPYLACYEYPRLCRSVAAAQDEARYWKGTWIHASNAANGLPARMVQP